jgi:hypothetical protein
MPRKSSRAPRPFEIVMDESSEERSPWDLDEHLNGCLVGYQTNPSYGAGVFFALEALWGIARDVEVRSKGGKLDPNQLDKRMDNLSQDQSTCAMDLGSRSCYRMGELQGGSWHAGPSVWSRGRTG